MTDIHLINWTIEEAKLLKAERSQPSDADPIPSLDQILIWPGDDPSAPPAERVDIAKSAPIQSAAEPPPVASLSNDSLARVAKVASSSPIAVSVSFSNWADVRTERAKVTPSSRDHQTRYSRYSGRPRPDGFPSLGTQGYQEQPVEVVAHQSE